jgi:hypothetical protein
MEIGRRIRAVLLLVALVGVLPGQAGASNVRLVGPGAYSGLFGFSGVLSIAHIRNDDVGASLSGPLRLELWAFNSSYVGSPAQPGLKIAQHQLNPLVAGTELANVITAQLPFAPLPVGQWNLFLKLTEYTGIGGNDGFADRDYLGLLPQQLLGIPFPLASPIARENVQKAYIAYYGRPADPPGQEFWALRMDAAGGSLANIIVSFGNSAEFFRRYGNMTNTELVTAIYRQALARDPDPAGLSYYVGELQAGRRTLQSITLDVVFGATKGVDAQTIANKLYVATYFTSKVAAECPYGPVQAAVDLLTSVTSSTDSWTLATHATDVYCGFY